MVTLNNLNATLTGNEIECPVRLRVTRIALITVILGPLIFLAVTSFLGFIQPGYDRIYDTISKLVWGQYGWSQTVCFYLFAFILASLAFILHQVFNGRKSFRFVISLILLMSAGFVIIAVLPTNAPGAPSTLTVWIHRFTAGIICLFFPLVCISTAFGLRSDSSWSKIGMFSLATGGLGVVLSTLAIVDIMNGSSWKGILERMILIHAILWIEVIGIRLMSILPTFNLKKGNQLIR